MKKAAFFFIFSLQLTSIPAQNIFQRIRVEHWDTKRGMPADFFHFMFQSNDGFLWMTGYSGLTRFDGVSFSTFNLRNLSLLSSDNINEIAETADSTIWIGSSNSGLLSYKKGKFQQHFKNSTFLKIAPQVNHQLLLMSGEGMVLFDTQSKKHQKLDSVSFMQLVVEKKIILPRQVDQADNQWLKLWSFTKFGRIKDGKYAVITKEEGYQDNLTYTDLMVDSQGRVWITSAKGLWYWNGERVILVPELKEKIFNPNTGPTKLITEDSKRGIWVAYSGGVAYLAHNAAHFVCAPDTYFKSVSNFTSILEDHEGNIWLTSDQGIFKMSYSKFASLTDTNGELFKNRISTVIEVTRNKYLLFSNNKLFWAENGVVTPYKFKNLKLNQITTEAYFSYKDTQANIWIGTANGVIKINEEGEKFYPSTQQVRYIFEDNQKKIWFGIAFKGIAFLNEKDELPPWFVSSRTILVNGICCYI